MPDRPYFGWVAAWAAAVYPPHLELVARPHVAPWAALTLTLLLLAVLWRLECHATRGRSGGRVGRRALRLEPILALAVPGVRGGLLVRTSQATARPGTCTIRALGRVALLVGVAILVAGPWMVRNRAVHGRLLPQNYTAATIADEPQPSYGQQCLRRARMLFLDASATSRTPHAPREERHHAERDEYASRATAVPAVPEEADQDAPVTFLTRASHVAVVAWLVLILIGLSVSWDRRRWLWPTYAIFAAVAAAHVLLAGVPWVRSALEPMTLVWASLAVAPLLVRLAPHGRSRFTAPASRPKTLSAPSTF